MVDLSIGKLLVIGVIALFFVSPQKLPMYAAQLGTWVRVARSMTDHAKRRVTSELGPDFEDVDWANLDPRRYHPKRLIADAWNAGAGPATAPTPTRAQPHEEERPAEEEVDLLARAEAAAVESERRRSTAPVPALLIGS